MGCQHGFAITECPDPRCRGYAPLEHLGLDEWEAVLTQAVDEKARADRLERELAEADRAMLRRERTTDHACADCVVIGPDVKDGFRCAWHTAEARQTARGAT